MARHLQTVKLRPSSADAAWNPVDVPHDWRIKTKPAPDHPVPDDYPRVWQGHFESGIAYYRKLFEAPELSPHERIPITFDGIPGFSDVWLNGFWIGMQPSAYSPLTIDLTEVLSLAGQGPNVLLVYADLAKAEGWWYEGGGIYRHVWLDAFSDVFVVPDRLFVSTPEVSEEEAQVLVNLQVCNKGSKPVTASVVFQITDEDTGEKAASASSVLGHLTAFTMNFMLPKPKKVIECPKCVRARKVGDAPLMDRHMQLHRTRVERLFQQPNMAYPKSYRPKGPQRQEDRNSFNVTRRGAVHPLFQSLHQSSRAQRRP